MNQKNICPHCNNRIINDNLFCSNCGYLLGIKCPKCELVSAFNMKYCKECGTLLKTDPNNRKQKKINFDNSKKKSKQILKSSNKSMFIFVIFVLLGVVIMYQVFKDQEVGQHFALTENKSNDMYTELKVIEIVSKFNCSCGTCGVTPLETCACNTAIQERQYIRNAIQNGKAVQKITNEIQNIYGSMKPEFLKEGF